MIKYHQNGTGKEYGEDGYLTNNWDLDKNYNDEYVNVHFRIEAKNYKYLSFSFTEEERKEFYNEVYSIGYGQTINFIRDIVTLMLENNLIAGARNNELIRSLNKTERKKINTDILNTL